MKEMEQLTVPQQRYTIQAMDTPLVMDDDDQGGLGYQNTLVSRVFYNFCASEETVYIYRTVLFVILITNMYLSYYYFYYTN